jgi:hypothetical protein
VEGDHLDLDPSPPREKQTSERAGGKGGSRAQAKGTIFNT